MDIDKEIQRFRITLLRTMPFYGDIVIHLSFVQDKNIKTAATDGKTIWYNPDFMKNLSDGDRNFVLMHEVFHVLLRHNIRNADQKRDPKIWNTACDIIINNMLSNLSYQLRTKSSLPFTIPSFGIFAQISDSESAENLYNKILADNKINPAEANNIRIRNSYHPSGYPKESKTVAPPSDIKPCELSPEEIQIQDIQIKELIRSAAQKSRGEDVSSYIPAEIYELTESRKLDWRRLLKDFLSEGISEETSYTTPERKYLHMDMILPGHGPGTENIEEIWAFVDSSGSVGKNEMSQFLTQLYRISKEFRCVFNICYWDTKVTDVYKKVTDKEKLLGCIPCHSGGTDINCIYEYMHENKIKPDVMLVLTDGYFGNLTSPHFSPKHSKKTILVLSSSIKIDDNIKKVGKITRLQEETK